MNETILIGRRETYDSVSHLRQRQRWQRRSACSVRLILHEPKGTYAAMVTLWEGNRFRFEEEVALGGSGSH